MQMVTRLVLLSMGAMTALAILAPLVAPAGQPCSSCHTGGNPSGSYVFKMPTIAASFPAVVPPGTPFNYTLKISHPGKYTVELPTATVRIEGAGRLEEGAGASRGLPSMGESGQTRMVSWPLLTGNATGTLFINATFQYTARYRHTNDHAYDGNPYALRVRSTVSVRPVALYTTASDLSLAAVAGRSATFEIIAYSDLRNITLTLSANLGGAVTMTPNCIRELSPGQGRTVQLSVVANAAIVDNGRIDIIWENQTGARDAAFVVVRTEGRAAGPMSENPIRLTGRATGLLSLGLLVTSVVLGYVKRGGRRRVRVHCAVSWFILGLSIYHGIMLVWGPYSRVWLGNWVLLGYASAVVMGVSSVNGLAQDWMTAKVGYRGWIWFHRISLLTAIVLVVAHAVLIGTDFRIVRDIFQAGG